MSLCSPGLFWKPPRARLRRVDVARVGQEGRRPQGSDGRPSRKRGQPRRAGHPRLKRVHERERRNSERKPLLNSRVGGLTAGASAGSVRVSDPLTPARLREGTRASPRSACRSKGRARSLSPRCGAFSSAGDVGGGASTRFPTGEGGDEEEPQGGLCTHGHDVPLPGRRQTPVPATPVFIAQPRYVNTRKDWM